MKKRNFPDRVTIELTNRCNVACTFCHRNCFDMQLGDMSEKLYKKIIDEIAEHTPIKMVPFFRGESILHPQFVEFMRYAKSRNIGPIQLFSNGLAFDSDMAQLVIEAGIDFVSFSLDTLDREIYKGSRLMGDLDISMKNVEYFGMLCRKEREKGNRAPQVQVSSVDLAVYRPKQQAFIDYWKQHVDIVRIYEEHDENGRFADDAVREKLAFISERKPCHKLYSDMIVYWDGRIALCNYDWNETHDFGDMNQSSLESIWNSQPYNEMREAHEKNEIPDNYICSKCEHWKAGYLKETFLGERYYGETDQGITYGGMK